MVDNELEQRELERATETVLALGKVAMDFAGVERVPRYDPETRESDVEHSFMLQLVAVELAETHFPGLDSGLVAKFSGVHDLPEVISGDVATFHVDKAMLAQKSKDEEAAIIQLEHILPPNTYSLLLRYEEQVEPEARFVRFVDKILPLIVDINGPGLQVMREDYAVETLAEYLVADAKQRERCKELFTEDHFEFLHKLRAMLSGTFASEFTV